MSITGVVSPGTEIIIVDKSHQGVLSLPSTTAEVSSRPRFVPVTSAPPSKVLRFRLLEAGPVAGASRSEHTSFVLEAVGVGERGLAAPLYLTPNEEGRVQLQGEPFRFLFDPSYPIFANSSYQLAYGPSRLIIPWAPTGGQKRPAEIQATLLPVTWFSPSSAGGSPSCIPKSGLSALLEDLRLRLLNGYTESLLCEKDIEFGTCPDGHSCGDTVGGRWKAGCVGVCGSPSEVCSYNEQAGKFACALPQTDSAPPPDQQLQLTQTGRKAPWWLWLIIGLVALFALVLVGGGLLYWLRFRRGRSSEKEALVELLSTGKDAGAKDVGAKEVGAKGKPEPAPKAAKSPAARRPAPAALTPARSSGPAKASEVTQVPPTPQKERTPSVAADSPAPLSSLK